MAVEREAGRAVAPARTMGAEGSTLGDLRAIKIVWQRELIRFWGDRARLVVSLVQPVLFLFVLGTGLSTIISGAVTGISFRTFIFPGVLAMSTMFTATFSAASLVWDREFGFLREMLVAPVSRGSLIVGKALGGATVATVPGLIMLSLAGTVGVPYEPALIVEIAVMLFLLSFVLTSVGLAVAVQIKQIQSFMAITQLFLLPMLFLSGAMFPLTGLPGWLHVLTRINPLTYLVDPMRRVVFASLSIPPAMKHFLSPGVTWGSWTVPIWLELGMVTMMGIGVLLIAIAEFRRVE